MEESRRELIIVAPPGRLRDSLFVLLESESGFTPLRPVENESTGLRMVAAHNPYAVILDANLPDDGTWNMLVALKRLPDPPHCLVLTHTADQQRRAETAGAEAALQAGFDAMTLITVLNAFSLQKRSSP